jgi:hypothetical protein
MVSETVIQIYDRPEIDISGSGKIKKPGAGEGGGRSELLGEIKALPEK